MRSTAKVYASMAYALATLSSMAFAQVPSLPSDDTFYDQPSNISDYAAGSIVRERQITDPLQGLFGGILVGSVYQFMYRSNNALEAAVADVMTVLVPAGVNRDSTKLLSYQPATDSANPNCAPSYSLQQGANNTAGADTVLIQAALNNGWYVVVPDFEGLDAEFTVLQQSGHAVLDGIRAALSSEATSLTGLSSSARYGLFGYSGGSQASEAAAELASNYAPDLTRFVGTAIGGLVPNLTQAFLTLNGGSGSGLIFSGAQGLANQYPAFQDFLNEYIIPSMRAEFNRIASGCISQANSAGMNMDFFSYFQQGRAVLDDPTFTAVLNAQQEGTYGIPSQPLYVFKAVGDEVSPVNDTDRLVTQYCNQGVTIQYVRNSFGDHGTEGLIGSPGAFEWLSDRFNGFPIVQENNLDNCEIQNVFQVSPDAAGAATVFGVSIAAQLTAAFTASLPPFTTVFPIEAIGVDIPGAASLVASDSATLDPPAATGTDPSTVTGTAALSFSDSGLYATISTSTFTPSTTYSYSFTADFNLSTSAFSYSDTIPTSVPTTDCSSTVLTMTYPSSTVEITVPIVASTDSTRTSFSTSCTETTTATESTPTDSTTSYPLTSSCSTSSTSTDSSSFSTTTDSTSSDSLSTSTDTTTSDCSTFTSFAPTTWFSTSTFSSVYPVASLFSDSTTTVYITVTSTTIWTSVTSYPTVVTWTAVAGYATSGATLTITPPYFFSGAYSTFSTLFTAPTTWTSGVVYPTAPAVVATDVPVPGAAAISGGWPFGWGDAGFCFWWVRC